MENKELYLKEIKLHKYHITADSILIVVGLMILFYVFIHIEEFKTLSHDVCELCKKKTGATCILDYQPPVNTGKKIQSINVTQALDNLKTET